MWPLCEKTYGDAEINSMIDVIKTGYLTMGSKVNEFEQSFAEYIGSKYAVMVNSGSSANLLSMAVLSNFKYSKRIRPGDKVLVPNICWSTSVYPVVQMGLIPVFVDIKMETLNADITKIETILQADPEIKAMVAVHILGNSTNMEKLMELKERYGLLLMEDTCESLGSTYNGKKLGTFGECGTYSFFFSHHITTGEGGMVVTDSEEICELLKCLRAHGWTRNLKDADTKNFHNKYRFVNLGYNLRPMEIQAAMGLVQLKKLDGFNNNRKSNYSRIIENLVKKDVDDNYGTIREEPNCISAWFAIPLLVKNNKRDQVIDYLEQNNVDNRPIVTGDFSQQPVCKFIEDEMDIKLNTDSEIAKIVDKEGIYIGLPVRDLSDADVEKIVKILIDASK